MLAIFKRKPATETHDTAQTFMDVIDRTQATIQFEPNGTIITANANFLNALGYSIEEVEGKHHSMFVAPAHVKSDAYRNFWKSLAEGKFFTDQFPRVAKNGSVIWIQATYAPVFDTEGKTVKVIKIATDITERQDAILELSQGLEELSQGNLAYRVPVFSQPDLKGLGSAFNTAQDRLSAAIKTVKDVSSAVERTSSEISQSSDDLSNRTESQAATLEETAAAIDELTASVKSAAEGARSVENIMVEARTEAENSGKVVQSAVSAMTEIEESSSHIAQIISVIDDIAFQTNLLALNAGVEAARAGEAGRGFAVVASEVRGLAQRSADAATEIKTLITDSSKQVTRGVDLVGKAGDALTNIVDRVNHISKLVTDIAEGAVEQSTALGEINTGVVQLDQVTQQNAAMVEQATAASHMLKGDATKLAERVAHFRTGDSAEVTPMQSAKAPLSMIKQVDDWNIHDDAVARTANGNTALDKWQDF